ncbi:hydrogenase subunit MbhD domain-containing protein [Methylorubrum thiocyanatum]|uniref:hydrogenase subunit MbhD domain-containing protein n=1 Tax=Methylorubrum thiocyanatum TaxID=47958 RepID=UPI00383A8B40
MSGLVAGLLLLAALSGLLVVLARDPRRQVFAMAGNGLVLGLLFLALQAPDVALSEIAVGTAVTPLLFLAALAAIAMDRAKERTEDPAKDQAEDRALDRAVDHAK